MTGKFLLDTNIVIALFGGDSTVKQRLEKAAEVFLPSIAAGELFFGAYKSTRIEQNLALLEEFIAHCPILNCDVGSSRTLEVILAP